MSGTVLLKSSCPLQTTETNVLVKVSCELIFKIYVYFFQFPARLLRKVSAAYLLRVYYSQGAFYTE